MKLGDVSFGFGDTMRVMDERWAEIQRHWREKMSFITECHEVVALSVKTSVPPEGRFK
jgi:hypothetical protein